MTSVFMWTGFGLTVTILLILDIGVFNKKNHVVKLKEALLWSAFWIGIALLFGLAIFYFKGYENALTYFTAYIVEESLSMDNLFVFLMIFSYFKIPQKFQHRVLFWGIIGAVVMRFVFIFTGIALINKFHWIIYVFGAILIYSGYKMIKEKDVEIHPEHNPVIKLFRKIMPVSDKESIKDGNFFIRIKNKLHATPLFVVLLVIETSDVIFAVDSIPAVLAISQDTFIVYTSNIMAILGLRSLYFALSGVMDLFHYLHYGLSIILIFIGVKMLISDFFHIPITVSLGLIISVLAISILFSILKSKNQPDEKKQNTD